MFHATRIDAERAATAQTRDHLAFVGELAETKREARRYLLGLPQAELEACYADTGRHLPYEAVPDGERRNTVMANRIIHRVKVW